MRRERIGEYTIHRPGRAVGRHQRGVQLRSGSRARAGSDEERISVIESADQGDPRDFAKQRSRQRTIARGVWTHAELDWRHAPGQRVARTAAAGGNDGVHGGFRAVSARGARWVARLGQGSTGSRPV